MKKDETGEREKRSDADADRRRRPIEIDEKDLAPFGERKEDEEEEE